MKVGSIDLALLKAHSCIIRPNGRIDTAWYSFEDRVWNIRDVVNGSIRQAADLSHYEAWTTFEELFVTVKREMGLEKIMAGIKHGDDFTCPTCGAPGRIDLKTPSRHELEFKCSIWLNRYTWDWECYDCWLK